MLQALCFKRALVRLSKLLFHKLIVETIFILHQAFVLSTLYDSTLMQDQNAMSVANGREAMSNDYGRASLHKQFQCFLDKVLAFRIQGTRGFI